MTNNALIIDPNHNFQTEILDAFSGTEVNPKFVDSGNQAIEFLVASNDVYNLILVSEESLEDETENFALRLRAQRRYAHTPLILLGRECTTVNKAFYAVGFTHIFQKNDSSQLRSYINRFVSNRNQLSNVKKQVVILEDDVTQQLITTATLEANSCECICFTSSEETLAAVDTLNPDILIVDCFLDGKMTGLQFIDEVKAPNHPWHNIPILATTGLDDLARKYEFLRAGANDYLVKPIEALDMSVRVDNLIKYKQLLDTVTRQREDMQYLAMHDQLTGLHNRHYMVSQVAGRINEAIRHKIPYSIIVMDIDHFKKVNDSWGHDKGDEVLKAISGILRHQCRDEDIIARIGGEEFILLLGYCELDFAIKKAEQLRKAIEVSRPADIEITASFGVAQLSEENKYFDKLFKAADKAVYRAKNQGRNCVAHD